MAPLLHVSPLARRGRDSLSHLSGYFSPFILSVFTLAVCGNYRKKIDLPLREIISEGLFLLRTYTNYIDKIKSRLSARVATRNKMKNLKKSGFICYRYIHNARLD